MHVLILFLDGIGLGDNNPEVNPFASMNTPTLLSLTDGQRWLRDTPRIESDRAIFIPTDANLGIEGRPQSASGQGSIITGKSVPQMIGKHWGPKPTPEIRAIIDEDNIFKQVVKAGKKASMINPFPPGFHKSIERGKRLPSSIQYGVLSAGIKLLTEKEYYAGTAVSPDWTGVGWTTFLGYPDAPTYSAQEAGHLMAKVARQQDLSWFSTWITDEIGHRGPFERGIEYMETFDGVMEGLLDAWDDSEGVIAIISDHGNFEVQGDRKHTDNLVPTVIIGEKRHEFAEGFTDLTHITPAIGRVLGI